MKKVRVNRPIPRIGFGLAALTLAYAANPLPMSFMALPKPLPKKRSTL